MREYDLIYIIQPDATREREGEIHAKVDSFVSEGGGTHLLRDDWGKRKLAYEIQKFQKGHYFQLSFLGDGAFVPDMERQLRLDVDVLRFLTVLANDNVKDIEARVTQAREYEAEQARRREERELLEAERAASEAAQAAEAAEAAAGEQAGSVDGQLDAGELGAEDQDSDANREDAGSEELETVAGQAEKPIPEATVGDDAEAKG
ncbi:MAG: 30S ribosomal protein S6 [Deltaproteobacteria bacterium]|nr:30S ribosomal protein S6 [Deltaproteobacteria bacterium]